MTMEQLRKEILKAIRVNKESIVLNDNIDDRTIKLLKFDYDDLKSFVNKCFKEIKKG